LGEGFVEFIRFGGIGKVQGGGGEDFGSIDFRALAGSGLAENKRGSRSKKSSEEQAERLGAHRSGIVIHNVLATEIHN
jgi:hypothetical protein